MTHPNPPPVSRAHVIAELYNLLGLFASLQTSRVQLAHQYEALPDNAGAQSAAHHRGSADAYVMAQTFIRERIDLLTRTGE
jgi:hypothetical protein